MNAILALKISGTGQDLLLVFENRLNHLHSRRGRSIVGAPRLQMLDDLSPAVARPLHQAVDRRRVHQLGDRYTSHGRIARQRHHRISVATEHKRSYILHRDLQLFRNEGTEAGGIKDAGHADDPLAVELRELKGRLSHRIERIGDDDQDGVRRRRHHLAHHLRHDLVVGVQQVIAAHPGLAGDAGGNDHDVGVYRVRVVIGPDYVHVAPLYGQRFQQVETLALGHALYYVDQHDVSQFLGRDPVGRGRTHVPCSYDGYFLPHISPNPCSRSFAWQIRSSSPWWLQASAAQNRR